MLAGELFHASEHTPMADDSGTRIWSIPSRDAVIRVAVLDTQITLDKFYHLTLGWIGVKRSVRLPLLRER
jgi:hypothetical protein